MSEQTTEERELAWRETLPPEMRPIAERYGQKLFLFAFNTWVFANAQQRTAQITQRLLQNMANSSVQLRKQAQEVLPVLRQDWAATQQAVEQLAQLLAATGAFELTRVQEAQRDLARAAQLAQAGQEADKIIVAH